MPSATPEVTSLVLAWGQGDKVALDSLIPFVHKELRRILVDFARSPFITRSEGPGPHGRGDCRVLVGFPADRVARLEAGQVLAAAGNESGLRP